MAEQDQRISEVVRREQSRLRNFIRRRVPDPRDAEDILQEVFYKLVEANRLLMPIDHIAGWLFRVARNRITDLFRKKKPEIFSDEAFEDEEGEVLLLEDLLPSPDAGPEALYARNMILYELELAVEGHVLPASLLSGRSADAQFGPAGQAARPQRAPQRRQAELWSTAGERPVAQQPRRGRNELNGRLFEEGGGSGGGLHLLPGAGGDPPPIPPRLCLRRRRLQAPRLSRWGREVRLRPRPDAGQRAGNPQQHP